MGKIIKKIIMASSLISCIITCFILYRTLHHNAPYFKNRMIIDEFYIEGFIYDFLTIFLIWLVLMFGLISLSVYMNNAIRKL